MSLYENYVFIVASIQFLYCPTFKNMLGKPTAHGLLFDPMAINDFVSPLITGAPDWTLFPSKTKKKIKNKKKTWLFLILSLARHPYCITCVSSIRQIGRHWTHYILNIFLILSDVNTKDYPLLTLHVPFCWLCCWLLSLAHTVFDLSYSRAMKFGSLDKHFSIVSVFKGSFCRSVEWIALTC